MNRKRKIKIYAAVIALTLLFGAIRPGHADPVISAPFLTVNVGDTITIPISVTLDVADNLTGFQFDLSYDSSIVTLLSFTDAGTDFDTAASNGGGVLTGLTGFLTPGLLSGAADSISGTVTGLQSPGGVLLNIDFRANSVGFSLLTFTATDVFLNFLDAGFSTSDGKITVNDTTGGGGGGGGGGGAAVPEPGTLVLFMSGLASLGARQLIKHRRR